MKRKESHERATNLRPWTSAELRILERNARAGADALAVQLGRTVQAVKQAAKRRRISLRKPGERRGLVLGQPRSESWRDVRAAGRHVRVLEQLRADVIAGRVDADAILDGIDGARVAVCPACGRAAQKKDGFCRPCYRERLIESYEREAAHADRLESSQRLLERERQRRHRSKGGNQ